MQIGLGLLSGAAALGAHKSQAHLPLAPSLPPLPRPPGESAALFAGAPDVVYGQAGVDVGGDAGATVAAALLTPADAAAEPFHEWAVAHPREGMAYFECPEGFDFRAETKSCIMITHAAPTESCPYGAYRDKATKHCVHTDSVAPDRTCPSGFGYFMRGCIRRTHIEPQFSCPAGYSRIGHRCFSMTAISAIIDCPAPFFKARPDFGSVEDVLAEFGELDERACVAQAIYPPIFRCENNGFTTEQPGSAVLIELPYEANVTIAREVVTDPEEQVVFHSRPQCDHPIIRATTTCSHPDFDHLTAAQAYAEVYAMQQEFHADYLADLLHELAAMPLSVPVCIQIRRLIGSLTCPVNYSLVRVGTESGAICLELPIASRVLNERGKFSRRDRRVAERRRGGTRLLNEMPEHHAVRPVLYFEESDFCESLALEQLTWRDGSAMCIDVKVAPPVHDCAVGRVTCKWLDEDDSSAACTSVCDLSEDPAFAAEAVCAPGDVADSRSLLDLSTGSTIEEVPVCVRELLTRPTTACPFGLGEPDASGLHCNALSTMDLLLTCPDGYTKVSAEKAAVEAEATLGDTKKSKRHSPGSLAIDVYPDVCELLEYAEYQVTCPGGYHREKARNTVHACVAEKVTKPSLVCPAGYLPKGDGVELSLVDEQACMKVVEIAPTLINPSSPVMGDGLEDHRHASRGEVTACILTKTGGLSCGTERKYHAQTDLDSQERFGQKYQEKYARKTARQK